eukprot:TRINITY_DN16836_c0_g1_i2.p1 TRINITY_DN16836_c0_g1~~TRINITY_DN16836_c0_g1_i2.p1  ORF type:complete len:391 (-),score=29.16 TRINITY_DN16836_c0_g1_i2:136-1278(-)
MAIVRVSNFSTFLKSRSVHMVLVPGDMSYADTNATRWDTYGLMVENLTSELPWMVCPGNHEIEADYYTGEVFKPYEARFVMPAVKPANSAPAETLKGCIKHVSYAEQQTDIDCTPSVFSGKYDWGNSFYSFTAGPMYLIALNPYTETHNKSAQYEWLLAELEEANRAREKTPWLVVMLHCPFYNSNSDHHGEYQTVTMRDLHGFEDLFFQHSVSLVLSGHVHAYERSFPVYHNVTRAGAPTYIVIGAGGNREGHSPAYTSQKPTWSAYREAANFGHGKVTIVNRSHMLWEWRPNGQEATDSTYILNPQPHHHAPQNHWVDWPRYLDTAGLIALVLGLFAAASLMCAMRVYTSRTAARAVHFSGAASAALRERAHVPGSGA